MPERKDHRSDVFVRCKTLCSLLLAASCSRACPKCSHVSESIRRPDVWSNDAKSKKGRVNGKDFTFSLAGSTKKPSKARRKSAKWLHDSGSTVHCINDKSLFYSIEDRNPGISLTVANNKQVGIEAIGSVLLQVRNQHGVLEQHLLQNVCYCPSFGRNILSVSRLWHENRLKTKFGGKCYLQSQSGSKYFLSSNDSPYGLQTDVLSGEFVFSTKQNIPSDSDLWHRRFMHSGEAKIKLLAKVLKQFTNYTFDSKSCDACQQGGAIRQPFGDGRAHRRKAKPDTSKRRKFYTYFGERISTDLCGPFPESLVGKCKYAIIFHDAYSRRIKIYALESKSKEDVLAAFQMFLDDHKHLLSRGVKEFHSDNGAEYINSNMDEFCEELCVRRSFTVPYTPQQNPHAERTWGSLLRKVRTSLVASGLPEHFWNFAILQAELIHNILPRSSEVASPFEITGESFDYSKLHCFGCKCYYFLPDRERSSKLSPRAVPAVYLGEDPERRGHLVYVPSLEWVTTSYHLVFSELEYLSQEDLDGATRFKVPTSKRVTFRTPYDGPQQYTERRDSKSTVIDEPSSHSQSFDEQQDGDAESDDTLPNQCSTTNCTYPAGHHGLCSTQLVDNNTPGPPSRRLRTRHTVNVCTTCRDGRCVFSVDPRQLCTHSGCWFVPGHDGPHSNQQSNDEVLFLPNSSRKVRVRFGSSVFEVLEVDLSDGKLPVPEHYADAIKGVYKEKWLASMLKEITDLAKHGTWEYVSRSTLPRGRKPLKSRWVYTIKYHRDGTIERYKSRFVACGYSQVEGKDFTRAFSATLRAASFRTLLAISSGKQLILEHFDVTSAFTQADIDDVDIWVEPPKGFDQQRDKYGTLVCKLKKALYGTKQASRMWQQALAGFLCSKEMGFQRSTTDPCLFLHESEAHGILILGIYVDDIILAHNRKGFDWFTRVFTQHFRSKHIGKLYWFLGVGIDQSDDTYAVSINQERYILNLVNKYVPGGRDNAVLRIHPSGEKYAKLRKASTDDERHAASSLPYCNLVGALLYLAVMSQPHISYHTSMLAKFMSDPTVEAYELAVSLLLYVANEPGLSINYDGSTSLPVVKGKNGSDSFKKHHRSVKANGGFVAYSDSSWGVKDDPYPMFGFCIYMFGGLVSFASKQLKVVCFSSCEAEYAACAYCCKEISFIRNICKDMGFILHGALLLGVDNTAALDVAANQGVTARTKHFDQAIHYFRDQSLHQRVVGEHILTMYQRADGFTKGLDRTKHIQWVKALYNLRVNIIYTGLHQ